MAGSLSKFSRPQLAVALVVLLGHPIIHGNSLPAATLPEGFFEERLVTGITGATAMEIAPDGRIFICEQTGALRVVKNGVLLAKPFVTVPVDSSWERGLLGVAFDPDFARNGHIYLNYTPAKPYPHHRISRFTARGDRARPGSEKILFEGDDQNKLGGGVKNGHQGGAIHFGKDGKLYIAIGDQTAGAPAQSMKTLQGKMLRINKDGSIPKDNPFYRTAKGKYRAIWALGLRNPFTFAVQPGSGRMFINDVGGANEEINEGVAGANYGWPTADHGPTKDKRFRGPIYWYKESSITGGTFYNPAKRQFPTRYFGKYFFNDFKAGWINVLDPDHPQRVTTFASDLGQWGVVDLKVGADGFLYYLSRNAWVRDQHFKPNTGALFRVRYTGNRTPPRVLAGPRNQTVTVGQAATFNVRASGTAPLHYQWQRNGADISGATGPSYRFARAARADGGARFRCRVTNAFGKALSETATLTVNPVRAERLAIWPRPGHYTGPVTVRLVSPLPRAVIRYSTDGSLPTATVKTYTGPFRLDRSATVKAQAFEGGAPKGKPLAVGYRITGKKPYGLPYRLPVTTLRVPLDPKKLPQKLSQTGVFASLAKLVPNPGIIPYTVNSPLWSDGAAKRRWIALPVGKHIAFSARGEWKFPVGTVLIKHFELATDETRPKKRRRLETRLLVVDATGNGYGVTYKWRADNRDADLLADGVREKITIKTAGSSRTQTWEYPGRKDCLTCHTAAARFVLGVKTRQLNGRYTYPGTGASDNQLRTWSYLGMFGSGLEERKIPTYDRLVAVTDARATLEHCIRSYLDANCANCHRPGNTLRANFDARFDTPLSAQGLIDRPTVSDSLNIPNPRVVAPRDLKRSMLYQRFLRTDNYRMPPLATHVPDRAAIAVFKKWINGLAVPPKRKMARGNWKGNSGGGGKFGPKRGQRKNRH
jgi:uncharacterized repeat protein (TIGR03806 family)